MQPAFVAALLRSSADGLAGLAATRLIEEDGPGPVAELGGFDAWRAQLRALVLELAAAVEDEAPELFAAHAGWLHEAFSARRSDPSALSTALARLGDVLAGSLPEPVARTLPPYLDAARARLAAPAHVETSGLPPGGLVRAWLDALLAGDERAALERLFGAHARGEVDARGAILEVLVPALREVGRAWHAGEVGIAVEHFATSVTRTALGRMVALARPAASNGRTVVVGAVAGDAHDLAVQIVSACFELDGWRVLSLGANTPAEDLADLARRARADLVVIGATLSPQREVAARTIARLKELERPPRVVVGGRAFESTRELWRRVGADARAASAEEAVRIGRELVGIG